MRLTVRRRLGALIAAGLVILVTAGVSGLALEQPLVATGGSGRAGSQPVAHQLSHVTLAAATSPCGFGGNGGGLPLPGQFLVNGSTDQGVDYAAPAETPECAMGDGVVVGNGINGFGPWAPIVQINDGPLAGRFVYYGHAGPDGLVRGGGVANGQQVSSVGAGIVGISTGPHLEVGFWCPLAGQPPAVGNPCGDGGDMLNYINGALGPSTCSFFGADQVCGAIRDKYLALGGPDVLGNPVTNETATPDGIGRYNYFGNGWAIYWTPNTGAWSLHGAILSRWAAIGWERGPLGYPASDETGTPDGVGRFNHFANDGSIYWTPATAAWSIHGAIYDHWAAIGWERSVIGYPITDETGTPDGIGRFNHFSKNGSIYWTPATHAHEVHGAVRAKWAAMGWERSVVGYPVTGEGTTPNKIGRYNYFSGHGAIYWTGPTGPIEIHGAILDKWASMGWETGALGFPVTDEGTTPNKIGRFNYFSGHGAIYWTPTAGAWSIHGAVLDKWASMGWETGALGFPVTDETGTPAGTGRFNHFSSNARPANVDGSIYWTPATAAHEVHGAIRAKWIAIGAERSCLGYPVSDVVRTATGQQSTFQHGAITLDARTGRATSSCP